MREREKVLRGHFFLRRRQLNDARTSRVSQVRALALCPFLQPPRGSERSLWLTRNQEARNESKRGKTAAAASPPPFFPTSTIPIKINFSTSRFFSSPPSFSSLSSKSKTQTARPSREPVAMMSWIFGKRKTPAGESSRSVSFVERGVQKRREKRRRRERNRVVQRMVFRWSIDGELNLGPLSTSPLSLPFLFSDRS